MTDEFKKARDEACNKNIDRGLLSEPKHRVFNIGANWAYEWHKQELADLKKANDILRAMVLVVQDKAEIAEKALAKIRGEE